MATWTTAYISDLPDGAFACIDSDGRHYPHHDKEGNLDMPHLRAAMSRIGDPSNTQCGKGHLMRHAREAGMGEGKALPVKATLLDDDAFRLLAFPFSGPIPFPGAPRGADLDAQWFTERTDIKADWLPWRPVDFHHGDDPLMGRTVLGKASDLGRADGPADEPDEDGWWVTVWMKRGERRLDLVRRLAERGAQLFGSSETVPGLATLKARTGEIVPWSAAVAGEIVAWPYWRQTLSTSPQNTHSVLRPLKATLDELEAAGERPGATFWTDVEDALRTLGHTLRTPSATGAGGAKAGQADDALRAALTSLLGAADALSEAITR